jgi:pullulanase-type alpha-1,6-glucosidase
VLAISTEGVPKGDLRKAQAHWLDRETIVWKINPAQAETFTLHYATDGKLVFGPRGVLGGQEIPLILDTSGLSFELRERFPHLCTQSALKIGPEDLSEVPSALKGQLAVAAFDGDRKLVDATGIQIPGVLDDLYAYEGSLGISYEGEVPTLLLWAPTARSVTLHLFADGNPETRSQLVPMEADSETGVWTITGDVDWDGRYYLYEVEVYVPSTGRVERNLVTDPYAVSLSMNSKRSQIIDLRDARLMPDGWDELEKPLLDAPEDIVIYELHMRDFNVNDPSVPLEQRGTFLAFTCAQSHGMQHLRQLSDAGLTHIHLLPVFDIATINENKTEWQKPDWETLAALPADSEKQQELLSALVGQDGYNWGYDPFHFTVPEGSYSTDPDSPARILEFRQMVQALNEAGLRVVIDVVYNHTNASGQNETSVLDKIVPGYYHRLDAHGRVEHSTCCENTATEHFMMRRLMVDSVVTWATAYKVDGFRFDLMGHHMVADMIAVKEALHGLTPEEDGIDGSSIYIYGEGWNFGEVANNARGVNATQLNMGGLGIGSFNDRVRDAVRGGNPFVGYQEQGFITGLYDDPNDVETRLESEQRSLLLRFSDHIRLALAGNLTEYSFTSWKGLPRTGAEVDYNGHPAGYAQDPQEHVPYISAHDNETLFDAIQYKAPSTVEMADRVRMQNLGISIVALAQGVPFYQAGVDLLRSKSFDRDSFNSGDWFNKLDFTYQENNWGVGLPPASKNKDNWPIMQPLLARPDLKPSPDDILNNARHFQEMLRIRKSSSLFRLRSGMAVRERVRFHNTGPDQIPGMIVMSLTDVGLPGNLDPDYDLIMVVFNATKEEKRFNLIALQGIPIELHPIQRASHDSVVKAATFDRTTAVFSVPARTTAVFVAAEDSVSGLVWAAEHLVEEEAAAEPGPTVASLEPTETLVEPTPTAALASPVADSLKRGHSLRALVSGVFAAVGAVFVGRRVLRRKR